MYRPTDRQTSLFSRSVTLSGSQKLRLGRTWAPVFREKVFPLLLAAEGEFGDLYHQETGRPNWSIARMLGILALQELNDLTDQDTLDALSFDTRWQVAVDLGADDAYLSRRSYIDFRSRLVSVDQGGTRARSLFNRIFDGAALDLGISTLLQRQDSTHLSSNIRVRGRADLFSKTVGHFLRALKKESPELFASVDETIRSWFSKGEKSWFGPGTAAQRHARLQQLAVWAGSLVEQFGQVQEVASSEPYQLLRRLFEEQCEVEVQEGSEEQCEGELAEEPAPQGSQEASEEQCEGELAEEEPAPQDSQEGSEERLEGELAEGEPAPQGSQEGSEEQCEGELAEKPAPQDSQGSATERLPGDDLEPSAAGESRTDSPPTSSVDDASPQPKPPKKQPKIRKTPTTGGHSLQSPFDPEAGYGHKGQGYSAQITETVGNELTELISDFALTSAATSDQGQTTSALERLAARGLLPEELLVDSGYMGGEHPLAAQALGSFLLGPVSGSQLPDDYIGRDVFVIDEKTGEVLFCPEGHAPLSHGYRKTSNGPEKSLHAHFDGPTCRGCPLLGKCAARPQNSGGDTGNFHVELLPRLLERDRQLARQKDKEWWKRYASRAGIEATNSELKRAHGFGKLRVRGGARVLLAVTFKLMACNIKRWAKAANTAKCAQKCLVSTLLAAAGVALAALRTSRPVAARIRTDGPAPA